MKHTDYGKALIALNRTVEEELKAALKAHGGKYTFPDDMLGPYVDIPGKPLKGDVWCLKTVRLDKDGYIQLTAVPELKPTSKTAKVLFADLDHLTLSYIIEEMDDAKGVVSVRQVKNINPDILFEMTCGCFPVLHGLGIAADVLKQDIIAKAKELTGLLESHEIDAENDWFNYRRIISEQVRLFIMTECNKHHIGEIHHLPRLENPCFDE